MDVEQISGANHSLRSPTPNKCSLSVKGCTPPDTSMYPLITFRSFRRELIWFMIHKSMVCHIMQVSNRIRLFIPGW